MTNTTPGTTASLKPRSTTTSVNDGEGCSPAPIGNNVAVPSRPSLSGTTVRLSLPNILTAIARNQSKRLGLTDLVHKIRGGLDRGGEDWSNRRLDAHAAHVLDIFQTMRTAVGNVTGRVGLELGPGDDVAVAYCFLKAGAKKMYTVERFDSVQLDERALKLFETLDRLLPGTVRAGDVAELRGGRLVLDANRLHHTVGLFEVSGVPEPVDFAYANDVAEHVDDPAVMFRATFAALKPNGCFVNNIDLAGHNAFSKTDRPLDFLTCPDWLWDLMFSHIVTTNRVRYSEFLRCARVAGFEIAKEDVLIRADETYLRQVRPDFIERYQRLADEDLAVIQCVLATVRAGNPLSGEC